MRVHCFFSKSGNGVLAFDIKIIFNFLKLYNYKNKSIGARNRRKGTFKIKKTQLQILLMIQTFFYIM